MYRTKLLAKQFSKNSQFYHPCKFEISPQSQALKVCALHKFIETYRKYAHYYANLDPLNLYNKYNSFDSLDSLKSSLGQLISESNSSIR